MAALLRAWQTLALVVDLVVVAVTGAPRAQTRVVAVAVLLTGRPPAPMRFTGVGEEEEQDEEVRALRVRRVARPSLERVVVVAVLRLQLVMWSS